jgi:branched-chain amino acid transport system permease protein
VILGVIAIVITLFLPRGLWGLISGNGRIRLFPVGYRLVNPQAGETQADTASAD